MAGIYIHIPFCKQACYYCDFHFSTNQTYRQQMVNAIAREAMLQKDYLENEPVKTIYFGGGTPSVLSLAEFETVINVLNKTFDIHPGSEITLEANPDDLSPAKLNDLKTLGFNRLSIGIQSFDNEVLRFLNRAHDATLAKACVHQAREAGFTNISLDLIYAIPGQGPEAWQQNIEKILELQPQHLSAYSLTIEEKTVFGRWASAGKLIPTDDDRAAHQLELLVSRMEQAGFEQYEVSNFALPGFESKHNSNYWKREKYLGLGPSAHSYNRKSRQYNVASNHQYMKGLESGLVPFTPEILSQEDQVNDYLLTVLRTSWGADLAFLKDELGYDLLSNHQPYLEALVSKKLATLSGSTFSLTRSGKLLADKISSDLFLLK